MAQEADLAACRYCLQPADEDDGGALIEPCNCRSPVHQRCLVRWILERPGGALQHCEICRERWHGIVDVQIQDLVARVGRQGGAAVAPQVQQLEQAFYDLAWAMILELHRERRRAVGAELQAAEAERRADVLTNTLNLSAARMTQLQAANSGLQEQLQAALHGGAGGGRIRQLERQIQRLERDGDGLRSQLRQERERARQLEQDVRTLQVQRRMRAAAGAGQEQQQRQGSLVWKVAAGVAAAAVVAGVAGAGAHQMRRRGGRQEGGKWGGRARK